MTSLDLSQSHKQHHRNVPDYCQIMRFRDANGQMKEMVFPKGLDLNRPKRPRTTFTEEQLGQLEVRFQAKPYLVGKERSALAVELGLSETQIKVWFQNRRTKHKRESGVQPDDVSSSTSSTTSGSSSGGRPSSSSPPNSSTAVDNNNLLGNCSPKFDNLLPGISAPWMLNGMAPWGQQQQQQHADTSAIGCGFRSVQDLVRKPQTTDTHHHQQPTTLTGNGYPYFWAPQM